MPTHLDLSVTGGDLLPLILCRTPTDAIEK
jgi:hypothetical protein